MHLGARAAHEIDRVMVRTAAHEGEPVLDPVRQPEAQHPAVVFDELLGLVDAERQMAELERADAGDRLVLCDRRLLGEHIDPVPFGSLNVTVFGMPGAVSLRYSHFTPSASRPLRMSLNSVSGSTWNDSLVQRA